MKSLKTSCKIILIVIILSILNTCFPYVTAQSPVQGTQNYIVMELEHEQILYKLNSEKETNSSILNRLMTCLITMDYQSVTTHITPKKDSISRNERFRLSAKEQYSIDSLIKATMLGGADNTAIALAEHIAASEQEFVGLMNEKAKQLGLKNTFFANVDGSPNELQHTTVLDMAIFIKHSLKNPHFKSIFMQELALWDDLVISNGNKLVIENNTSYKVGGVLGYFNNITTAQNISIFYVETGPTEFKDTMKLLIIVAGSTDEQYVQTSELLLENVLNNYKRDQLVKEGEIIYDMVVDDEKLNVVAASDVYCIMPKDIGNVLQNKSFTFIEGYGPDEIRPPIAAGTILGTANYHLKDGSIIRFSMKADRDIELKKTTIKSLLDKIREYDELYTLLIALLILEAIILLLKLVAKISSK